MTDLKQAADATAREFLSGTYAKVREFDVTLARNAILDWTCRALVPPQVLV